MSLHMEWFKAAATNLLTNLESDEGGKISISNKSQLRIRHLNETMWEIFLFPPQPSAICVAENIIRQHIWIEILEHVGNCCAAIYKLWLRFFNE